MVNSKSRSISLLAVLIITAVVLVVSFSALGIFDPLPDGEPIWQAELNAMQVGPESAEIRWLNEDLPLSPVGIRLTAGYETGEIDSAYGLILGQEDGSVTIMISPLGYAAILQQPYGSESEAVDYYLPWQTWPHIRTGDEINELFVYLNGDTMTVRINREWLWEGDGIEESNRMGIIGESFGEEVTIDFHTAELSAVENSE